MGIRHRLILGGIATALVAAVALATAQTSPLVVLDTVPPDPLPAQVPEPPNLSDFVADKAAAIRLGKALFWDMQIGSDGATACATCHFHAGADSRSINQLNPGLLKRDAAGNSAPDRTFASYLGANFPLNPNVFPL